MAINQMGVFRLRFNTLLICGKSFLSKIELAPAKQCMKREQKAIK